jgi:signal transduction histidine kinase
MSMAFDTHTRGRLEELFEEVAATIDVHRRGSDIAATLHRCARLLRTTLPQFHRIHAVGVEEAPRVALGEGYLLRLLHNLIVNASAAEPRDGRIAVSVVALPTIPRVQLDAPRPCVRLTVADAGRGITKLEVAQAFWASTLPPTSVPLPGLATAFAIVRSAGGRIDIGSTPGRGTRVHCYIPQHVDGGARR